MAITDKLGNILPTNFMVRFITNAGVNRDALRAIILSQYKSTCKRAIKKANKEGKELFVSDLTKAVTDNKDFKELCESIDIDRHFLEAYTKEIIKQVK